MAVKLVESATLKSTLNGSESIGIAEDKRVTPDVLFNYFNSVDQIIDVTHPPEGLTPAVGDAEVINGVPTMSGGIPQKVGGGNATDNSTALQAIAEYMDGDKSKRYILFFPAGNYGYFTNKWIPNTDVIIYGPNASVFCYNNPGAVSANITWATGEGDIFHDVLRGDQSTYPPDPGVFFNTVEAGSQTLTLTTLSDHSRFDAGDRAFIYGYNQQVAGSPPNPRYFEWIKIVSKDTGTGVLTLEKKLRYRYDSTWYHDTVSQCGKPQIISLDRTNYRYPKLFMISGLTILDNPVEAGDGAGLVTCAEQVVLDNVKHGGYLTPSMSRLHRTLGGSYAATDLDKMCNTVHMDGVEIQRHLYAGTGINELSFENGIINGYVSVASKIFRLINNQINMTADAGNQAWLQDRRTTPVSQMTIRNNRILVADNLPYAVDNLPDITITIKSSSAGQIKVDVANSGPFYAVDVGTILISSDSLTRRRVTGVGFDGTDHIINHDGGNTFTGTVSCSSIIDIDVDDSNIIVGPGQRANQSWKRLRNNVKNHHKDYPIVLKGKPNRTEANRRIIYAPTNIILTKVEFILHAKSGSSDTTHEYYLNVKTASGDGFTTVFTGITQTSGAWVIVDVQAGTAQWSSGDWTNNTAAAFTGRVNFAELIVSPGSGTDATYADDTKLPEFEARFYGL